MSDPNVTSAPSIDGAPAQETALPEVLKGKTPEEIFKILQAEHISEMSAETQRHASTMEQIATRPAPQQYPFVPPSQQQAPVAPQEFDIANPDAYLQDQVNRRMAPIVASMAQAGRDTGRSLLTAKISPEEWKKYGADIEQLIDGMAPAAQAQPRAYESAYNVVRSMHIDEIITERVGTEAKKLAGQILTEMGVDASKLGGNGEVSTPRPSIFQGRTGVATSAPRSTSAALGGAGKPKLSEAEKLMCSKFEMTEDEYILYRGMNTDFLTQNGLVGERR